MIILITGGSGSGKSAYAEKYITMLSNRDIYYIATMRIFDEEGQAKAERHQKMRRGKGFQTIEQPTAIEQVQNKIPARTISESTALLECISNLTANEMFSGKNPETKEAVIEKILQGVEQLGKKLKYFVIVTNNVFEDGNIYDETTMEYLKAMGSINENLAVMADKVFEVVAGIPIVVKEGK